MYYSTRLELLYKSIYFASLFMRITNFETAETRKLGYYYLKKGTMKTSQTLCAVSNVIVNFKI